MLEFTLLSPLAAALLVALQGVSYSTIFFLDCDDCAFNDLGKLMLGGVILAVLAGGVFTVVRLWLRSRRTGSTQFVSINPSRRDE